MQTVQKYEALQSAHALLTDDNRQTNTKLAEVSARLARIKSAEAASKAQKESLRSSAEVSAEQAGELAAKLSKFQALYAGEQRKLKDMQKNFHALENEVEQRCAA